jgi:hypothetical protein
MGRRLQTTDRYDATPAAVFAAFHDEKFVRAKYEALRYPEFDVLECSGDESGAVIKTRRLVPANVPGFAKKLFGDTTEMIQTDTWGAVGADGVRSGTWTIDVPGKPVSVKGTITLAPDGDGAVVTIDGEMKANVPLIGGKLEKFAGEEAEKTLVDEYEFAKDWLRQQG